jgi:hypothetical protein
LAHEIDGGKFIDRTFKFLYIKEYGDNAPEAIVAYLDEARTDYTKRNVYVIINYKGEIAISRMIHKASTDPGYDDFAAYRNSAHNAQIFPLDERGSK